MAQDGIDDYELAKRKAARQLGLVDTTALPGNHEIEVQLRAYQGLYQGEEQRERLRELRQAALQVMGEIADFHPYLTGPVLMGTAGRYSDVDIQVFTDDAKLLELRLLDHHIGYETSELHRWIGGEIRSVSVLSLDWDGIAVNISVLDSRDERVSIRTSAKGSVLERASPSAVKLLLESDG